MKYNDVKYSKLSKEEQEKICEGYGTVIVDLENGDHICEFNMEDYEPPQYAIESFARSLLPMIQEYYSNEENRKGFEEQTETQDNK